MNFVGLSSTMSLCTSFSLQNFEIETDLRIIVHGMRNLKLYRNRCRNLCLDSTGKMYENYELDTDESLVITLAIKHFEQFSCPPRPTPRIDWAL